MTPTARFFLYCKNRLEFICYSNLFKNWIFFYIVLVTLSFQKKLLIFHLVIHGLNFFYFLKSTSNAFLYSRKKKQRLSVYSGTSWNNIDHWILARASLSIFISLSTLFSKVETVSSNKNSSSCLHAIQTSKENLRKSHAKSTNT